MEKIFEQPLEKPLKGVRQNMNRHIALLNKKYEKQNKQFQIKYTWDEDTDILTITSIRYGITAFIQFTKSKIIGSIEIPLLLRAIAWTHKEKIIKEVLKELNVFLKKI